MRIEIKKAKKRSVLILLPNCLIMNPITALLAGHSTKKKGRRKMAHASNDLLFTPKQLRRLFREIKRMKRKYRNQDWIFVEVQEANGDRVKVRF